MIDLVAHLSLGFQVAFTPENLAYCFLGALLGTLIGVLPGIGPTATIAILLPLTFSLTPVTAIIMLAGIYYGSQYGGSTTAILVNLPGEASSVVTAIDGYQLARQGRAGEALAIAALGSFFAGCVATLVVAAAAVPLAAVAGLFGPAEYAMMMIVGLIASIAMGSGNMLKSLAMVACGLALSTIGTDVNSGALRYTFGFVDLADGLDFVVLAMGIFGIGEMLKNVEQDDGTRQFVTDKISGLWPGFRKLKQSFGAVIRGTAIGSVLGVLPGSGGALSSFVSYALEKKISRNPNSFGNGAIEGVAGPESANNAGAQTSFIPLLTLGIPSNSVMAMMVGALLIQGIQPGPLVMQSHPDLIWGLIVSMWLGNVMLVIINLPLIGIWVQLLKVPYRLLFPAIMLFCCIGVYTLGNSVADVYMLGIVGIAGYLLLKLGFEPAPLLLSFILGQPLEENIRRALLLSRGDPSVFVTHGLSLAMLLIAVALIVLMLLPAVNKKREEAFVDT